MLRRFAEMKGPCDVSGPLKILTPRIDHVHFRCCQVPIGQFRRPAKEIISKNLTINKLQLIFIKKFFLL